MNSQYFSAFAALAGSVVGGFMMLASSWLSQNAQARTEAQAQHRSRREELYKDFIEESARLYADALGHNEAELAKFVKLYALIGRTGSIVAEGRRNRTNRCQHHHRNVPGAEQDVPRLARRSEQRRDRSLTCV